MAAKCFKKLQTLPQINTKINGLLHQYHNVKHSSALCKLGFMSLEMLLKICFNFSLLLAYFVPKFVMESQPVTFLDEFICHQLDFIEKKLSKNAGSTYRTENTMILRLAKFAILLCRITLIWPRVALVIIGTLYQSLRDEINEDIKLMKGTFLSKPVRVRRSLKRVRARRAASSPSAQRKRKHEDASDDEVYEYLYVNESYQSENDPDYVIGDTTFDEDQSGSENEINDEEREELKCEEYLCNDCTNGASTKTNIDTADLDLKLEAERNALEKQDEEDEEDEEDDEDEEDEQSIECEESSMRDRASTARSPDCQKG